MSRSPVIKRPGMLLATSVQATLPDRHCVVLRDGQKESNEGKQYARPGPRLEQDKLQLHMGTVRLISMTVIACFGAAKLIKFLDAAIVTEYLHAEYEFNPGQRSGG